ncbi:hypothetical protein Tco_1225283, partial [Tanacetum coccineum]
VEQKEQVEEILMGLCTKLKRSIVATTGKDERRTSKSSSRIEKLKILEIFLSRLKQHGAVLGCKKAFQIRIS